MGEKRKLKRLRVETKTRLRSKKKTNPLFLFLSLLLSPATELKAVPPEKTTSEGPSLSRCCWLFCLRRGVTAALSLLVPLSEGEESVAATRAAATPATAEAGAGRSGILFFDDDGEEEEEEQTTIGARARPPFDLATAQELEYARALAPGVASMRRAGRRRERERASE